MKVAELLAQRHRNWSELQRMCMQMQGRSQRKFPPDMLTRFAALYRSACADLALADAYQLPPNTVQYLHRLVANAHNQLYRSRSFDIRSWSRTLLVDVPQRLFGDNSLRAAFLLFFGLFVISFVLAANSRDMAEVILGDMAAELEDGHSTPFDQRASMGGVMTGYYIQHNAYIGLRCFAMGVLLLGLGGLIEVSFNGVVLGAAFGYMSTVQSASKEYFFEFVTAHGPFELTAIVLSAAAGIRLGFSIVNTRGLTRAASLRRAGRETLPIMMAAVILFCLAALIEGNISPSTMPYVVKTLVGALSCLLLMVYFVLLGLPPMGRSAAADGNAEGRPQPGTWEAAMAEEE